MTSSKSLCARAQEKSRPRRFMTQVLAFAGLRVAAYLNCAALVAACVFLLVEGSGALTWDFIVDAPQKMMTEGGVFPCLVGTFLLAAGAIAMALPFGVACAGIVAAVLISRQLQNTQAQTRKQKDEKSAYHRKKGGK